jgi:hypothetical protein
MQFPLANFRVAPREVRRYARFLLVGDHTIGLATIVQPQNISSSKEFPTSREVGMTEDDNRVRMCVGENPISIERHSSSY